MDNISKPIKKRRNDIRIMRRLWFVFLSDLRSLLLAESFTFLFMGAWLVSPFWDTFITSQSYRAMAMIMAESWWGAWFLILAALLAWAAVDFRHRSLRSLFIFLGTITWFFLGAVFWFSNSAALGVGLFLAHGFVMSWVFIRQRLDV